MENEIDKIKNLFQVTPFGEVFELFTGNKVDTKINHSGYEYIRIGPDTFYVHRMVANLYLENNDKTKFQVNHIDGNKTNNTLSNLEWVTELENLEHAIKNNLISSTKGQAKIVYDFVTNEEIRSDVVYDYILNLTESECKDIIKNMADYQYKKGEFVPKNLAKITNPTELPILVHGKILDEIFDDQDQYSYNPFWRALKLSWNNWGNPIGDNVAKTFVTWYEDSGFVQVIYRDKKRYYCKNEPF